MRVLLVSTYELGHQPLHVASPASALLRAGHEVRCLDLSVQPFDRAVLSWAEAVAISVPMHTAMRLAIAAARRMKEARPGVPVCLYGLYAPVSRDLTVGKVADRVVAGEYEPALVAWVDELAGRRPPSDGGVRLELGRTEAALPARHLLPPLDRYAHLRVDGEHRLVGYVEASHGCRHRCRHCPVPSVYDGRIRVVAQEAVLDDVAQLVEMGARHITFGDPDFLNGPRHAMRVVEELHRSFPDLTFDCTTKVEHLLAHADLLPRLAAAGCLFVVSAFETTNDRILGLLDKGHTAAEAAAAVDLVRRHGMEIRPSWLPFTPWTSVSDLVEILDFIARHDLAENVDPVQLTIRLLIPEGSLLLERPELAPYLEGYDAEGLSYRWRAEDPAVDALAERLARRAADGNGEPPEETLEALWRIIVEEAGREPEAAIPAGAVTGRPRLTEPWFC